MKKIFTLYLSLFFIHFSFAQNPLACDGQRYVDEVFSEVEKTTVTYGSNANIFGVNQNLKMDIYQPAGDTHIQRPVIVLAFGGSFVVGSRQTMEGYCEQFARQGYVAATIDYRLGFLGASNAAVTGAVLRAVSDMKAAVRYFREDAALSNTFKVHPDYILAGGYSAGAITALHAAYLDLEDDNLPADLLEAIEDIGGINGNTGDANNQSFSSEVFAVYSLSGGMGSMAWLDENETEPLVSYHGTSDNTVPFNSGLANGLAQLDGSASLHTQADLIGLPNLLSAVNGGGHLDIHSDIFYEEELAEFNLNSSIFLQNLMCPDFQITDTKDLTQLQQPLDVFPNPSDAEIQFDFGKFVGDYQVRVFDQLGRSVSSTQITNATNFSLTKSEIGQGVFFVNVLFEDAAIAPLTKRIIFK